MRVGFVGAGRMGRPMVAQLVAAGHTVRVLARTDRAHAELAALGATPVNSAIEVARGTEVVLVCVFTDDQVRELCLGGTLLGELPRGALIVLHTTGSPETADAVAARARDRGIGVVDGPVSGGPHDIAAGTLTVFLGGTESDVITAKAVVGAYANPMLHVGALGAGQRVKLVNNILFAAQIGLVAEAVRLGAQLGLPEPALLAALPHASSGGRAISSVAARGSVDEFRSTVGEFLRKDIAVAHDLAAALGADLGLLGPAVRAGLAPIAPEAPTA
ncbi:NAD(P)-dependent oxidoreductase [Nocardia sp. FBN12]|uniref:NAD(P)-dependent oxidoreductase n=1 Tax=Nocardia sp. FBN12 TaxID=3419766 RepID=UPI003D03D172